jgi:hypothetical protein
MKSNLAPPSDPCSPGVLAVSTPSSLVAAPERLQRPRSFRRSDPHSLRPTPRRRQLLELLLRQRVLTDHLIQLALYTPGGASRCQYDLTRLVRHRWIDRLPRESVNQPYVYLLTRRAVVGLQLLRERHGDAEVRRRLTRLGPLEHQLGVVEFRVRIEVACRELGWTLKSWQEPAELERLLRTERLIPDGYAQVARQVDGQEKTAGFFLELERTSRAALATKFGRYRELYRSGRYRELFGTRALRVLVVFTDEPVVHAETRLRRGLTLAEQQDVSFARFSTLERVSTCAPQALLLEAIWRQPGRATPVPLFSTEH